MNGLDVRWDAVSHAYGGTAVVQDISLHVQAGESVALLGHNGAGKTTLSRMLMGLVRPRAGRVTVGDWDVATKRPDEMASRVGYAFQHADQQLFKRTVQDDVEFGPRKLGLGIDHVHDILMELDHFLDAHLHPYDLPAPVRKVVTLAGVLAMQPSVLVLDEPTAGFDRGLRDLVVAVLRARMRDGVTLITVSHDLEFVHAIASREVMLEQGRIVSDVRH